ncbi:hypothetical protein [Vagococcus fluvialis]|uniref:hypothetical protein n=1 Tax=Vagococcus fluvialis TaxID=2738 RepID=UPI001D0A278F|nr:hypothetical protein [Vagococcus fluvialis]UDM74966.1 hypothetical protein K5K99_05165 [Vagococcus fluvialis]UDM75032.1 hypothetical protein K5K99_05510 [Vagococcus fluvialis]
MNKVYEVVFVTDKDDDYILYSNNNVNSFWIGARSDNEGYFNQEFTLEEIFKINPNYVPFVKEVQNG